MKRAKKKKIPNKMFDLNPPKKKFVVMYGDDIIFSHETRYLTMKQERGILRVGFGMQTHMYPDGHIDLTIESKE